MKVLIFILFFISLSINFLIGNLHAKTLKDYPNYLQSKLKSLDCYNIKNKFINVQNFYSYDYDDDDDVQKNSSYILDKSPLDRNLFHKNIVKKGNFIDYQFFKGYDQKNSLETSYTWALFYNLQLPNSSITKNLNHFKIYPKELGEHELFLIQKTNKNSCLLSYVSSFYVTDNPSYKTITEKKFKKSFSCYQTFLQNKQNKHCKNLPSLDELYHLKQIDAPKAWNISTGSGVKVALIDTGINYLHPYLKEQIIVPNNNQNSDKSFGPYDFEFSDLFAFDEVGHGSQMAGFISSPFGVAPESKTLVLKINPRSIQTIINAFKASIKNKVHIINFSLVFSKYEVKISDKEMSDLISVLDKLLENDILVIQAAGNHNQNLDIPEYQNFYSQFNYPNWVKVAAYDENFKLSRYSNYSNINVDIIAPGGSLEKPLLSTFISNQQGVLLASNKGTSQAAAITSGIAALIRSQKPYLSAVEVKEILLKSGRLSKDLSLTVKSGRILNALDALQIDLQ
ncbi:MAG: S8 family serine peptidase [Bdellovibrionales bacterium]|nr:S8 family serine peptidase [Bdellovibrionales bacterium]